MTSQLHSREPEKRPEDPQPRIRRRVSGGHAKRRLTRQSPSHPVREASTERSSGSDVRRSIRSGSVHAAIVLTERWCMIDGDSVSYDHHQCESGVSRKKTSTLYNIGMGCAPMCTSGLTTSGTQSQHTHQHMNATHAWADRPHHCPMHETRRCSPSCTLDDMVAGIHQFGARHGGAVSRLPRSRSTETDDENQDQVYLIHRETRDPRSKEVVAYRRP